MLPFLFTAGLLTAGITNAGTGRALPANAPHGYTPQEDDCPSDAPTIRLASSLSDEETSWLRSRRQATLDPMRDLLGRLNIRGLDTDQYINNHRNNVSNLPNIGIAVSGGGYRAMLNGAGVLEAFDSRTPNSTSAGQLGGLLQSTTYLAGLSGGSWLVGSIYTNNYTSVNDILAQDTSDDDSGDIWQLENSIFEGPDSDGIQLFDSVGYYATLVSDTDNKDGAGFNVTITDYWGRALSFQLVNATDGGPEYTWSSIAEQGWFSDGSAPMPLLVADGRAPGQKIVSDNSTVYTFTPFEFGSNDPTVYGFAPMQYVGTDFFAGETSTDQCVTGFDNVGFVMGTSSSLFNSFLTTINNAQTAGLFSSALQDALTAVLRTIGEDDEDIADYPNPFFGWRNESNPNSGDQQLTLVDGGEDLQNIPFHPLIQPLRHVDVIFAVDSSADTNASWPVDGSAPGWPSGAAIIATYERSLSDIGNGTDFASVPDVDTFFNLGLNKRPTFFGCDASNLSSPSPLIVYMPNAPYVYNSNVSTFDLDYNDTERNAIVLNGYNMATQGNGSIDDQWPTCVGCAILSRSLDRTGTDVPSVCRDCFDQYCWDGTTDNSKPDPYQPNMALEAVDVTSGARRWAGSVVGAVGCAVLSGLMVM
ncbi:Lysophospholipase 1 [Saxophila tyrrhenica]|uniref:Lysophospholipase n=1 Tax=Saxophila tyrrhenica TaxID=1690608 RepID=A0AAV9NX45_9PEZI|nr:Lysophospholipase 1 [Saxophila tyrrhenica]